MKLLIADDEQRIRKGLLSSVTSVYLATDGEEALEQARRVRPQIIISDIKMPGLTGLDLAEHIKKYAMDTAVILLTGFSDFEYAQRALRNECLTIC